MVLPQEGERFEVLPQRGRGPEGTGTHKGCPYGRERAPARSAPTE